ncbi:Uncharacterised protein [Yersinia pseudotuberculosis]|nr:Uncharacterised protein [Yersinia pseudotuberculosis]
MSAFDAFIAAIAGEKETLSGTNNCNSSVPQATRLMWVGRI